MKLKEYFRLAKHSINLHPKSTKAIVMGFAFGFILLIPIVVALIGINLSIHKQLNKYPYILYYETEMTDYRIRMESYYDDNLGCIISGSENISYFENAPRVNNRIVYESANLSSIAVSNTDCTIGDYNPFQLDAKANYLYSIIDLERSNTIFPTTLQDYFPSGIFVDGCDQGFTNQGKGQVIVTEKFLEEYGYNAQDVYLQYLTLSASRSLSQDGLQGDFIEINGYICKDYLIVGVLRAEVSELYASDFHKNELMASYMFFTGVNLYYNGEGLLKPQIRLNSESGKEEVVYSNLDNKDELNEEYMMLGWYESIYNTKIYIDSFSYQDLYHLYGETKDYYYTILNKTDIYDNINVSDIFSQYMYAYQFINLFSYAFIIVSIVVIMSAIINLFVTLKDSINQRRFYLTMLRAIGAKDHVIPKLYLAESLIITTRACGVIAVFGSAIAIMLKLFIDSIIQNRGIQYNISISWATIFLSVIAIVLFLFVINFILSYICIFKLSKKPIISILNDN